MMYSQVECVVSALILTAILWDTHANPNRDQYEAVRTSDTPDMIAQGVIEGFPTTFYCEIPSIEGDMIWVRKSFSNQDETALIAKNSEIVKPFTYSKRFRVSYSVMRGHQVSRFTISAVTKEDTAEYECQHWVTEQDESGGSEVLHKFLSYEYGVLLIASDFFINRQQYASGAMYQLCADNSYSLSVTFTTYIDHSFEIRMDGVDVTSQWVHRSDERPLRIRNSFLRKWNEWITYQTESYTLRNWCPDKGETVITTHLKTIDGFTYPIGFYSLHVDTKTVGKCFAGHRTKFCSNSNLIHR